MNKEILFFLKKLGFINLFNLIFLILLYSLFEVISIASIFPLLKILVNPDIIDTIEFSFIKNF